MPIAEEFSNVRCDPSFASEASVDARRDVVSVLLSRSVFRYDWLSDDPNSCARKVDDRVCLGDDVGVDRARYWVHCDSLALEGAFRTRFVTE